MGYDFLWIDTEHTAIDYQVLLYHLMGAKAGGTDTLVRIPWNNQVLAKRVLEMGYGSHHSDGQYSPGAGRCHAGHPVSALWD